MEPDEHLLAVAEAFSRKALVYDEFGEDHENLERMRFKVREHVAAFLKPGDRILELNAGTGSDAAYFARQGFHVHAIDISPGMLAQIEQKITEQALHDRLTVQLCSFTELQQVKDQSFHYVFSNMGGVNCEQDLPSIIRGMEGLLSPGGYVTWVVMPRICPWELGQLFFGNLKLASRRLHRQGVFANVEGIYFKTYYYSPLQVRRAFGKNFKLVKLQGLAVFTPPADHKSFSRDHRRLNMLLQCIDDKVSGFFPFNQWGDFFILTLRYDPR